MNTQETALPLEARELNGKEIRIVAWAAPQHVRLDIDRFQLADGFWTKLYVDINDGKYLWFIRDGVLDHGQPGQRDIGRGPHQCFENFEAAFEHFSMLKRQNDHLDYHETEGGEEPMDTLEDSRLEFMRKSHELGKQLAKEWLDHVDDYGLLNRIAHGHLLAEVPELVREEIFPGPDSLRE